MNQQSEKMLNPVMLLSYTDQSQRILSTLHRYSPHPDRAMVPPPAGSTGAPSRVWEGTWTRLGPAIVPVYWALIPRTSHWINRVTSLVNLWHNLWLQQRATITTSDLSTQVRQLKIWYIKFHWSFVWYRLKPNSVKKCAYLNWKLQIYIKSVKSTDLNPLNPRI